MFQLLKNLTTGELFLRQLPLFAVSFGIAELFYKFGSFALECVAFLATWFVLDGLVQLFWHPTRATDEVKDAGS